MARPDDLHLPAVGGVRTYGGRQGRMGPTRRHAFDELLPKYAVELPLTHDGPLIVEIGCGAGEATAAMAPADAERGALVIACEPNGAMLANLAVLIDARGLRNVRLWHGDAFDLLAQLPPASVAELRIWFPDPWPKARQSKKRLLTPLRLGVLVDSLEIGGWLRAATDDACYADEALAAIAAEPRLEGGRVERPTERPITRFERRGIDAGREAVDMTAERQR